MILVNCVYIKVKLNEEDYDILFKKKALGHTKFIEPKSAELWLNKNLISHPTKEHLDKQREKEINSLDLMQSTNLPYHMESIIEMQAITSVVIWYRYN